MVHKQAWSIKNYRYVWDVSACRPGLGQKKLKEQKKAGHPAERLQASFDKCWADTRVHAAGRDNKYDAR
jgi:hypothetical protein